MLFTPGEDDPSSPIRCSLLGNLLKPYRRAHGNQLSWRAREGGGLLMLSPAPPGLPHVHLPAFALRALLTVATSTHVAASSLAVFAFASHP